jgi:hypothetical protein
VSVYFVIDPGTGYSYSYTTSDDSDVAGASQAGLGLYLGNTGLRLTTDETDYTLYKDAQPTTLRVTASTSNDDAFLDNVTYQWYEYDPIDEVYTAINGATDTSYEVSFDSLKWRNTQLRCTATDQNGSTSSEYFYVSKKYNDLEWIIDWTGSTSRRVTYGATENLEIQLRKWVEDEDEGAGYVSMDTSGMTIQWYEYSDDEEKYLPVSSTTQLSYTTAPITEEKRYMCVVTDSNGMSAYQTFSVNPKQMDVVVNGTYYEIASGGDVTVGVTATPTPTYCI